jgi:subtilisin family serine protease
VNMSLGRAKVTDDTNGPLHEAIKRVKNNDIVVVVAAGNDASKEVSQMVPAGFPEVLAVASTTATAGSNQCSRLAKGIGADTASYFTTDGKLTGLIGVTISAPGEEKEDVNRACFLSSTGILSLSPTGGTARMSGTSQAAPHVAGVVARYLLANVLPGNMQTTLRIAANTGGTAGKAPVDSPAALYTHDGEREGIAQAP